MKIECPICGILGLVQKRKSGSVRVQHYQGFHDGKRLYSYHKIDAKALEVKMPNLGLDGNSLEVNGQQNAEVNKPNSALKMRNMARDVGFEPTRPFDHRLSRPAPYQARAIPHNAILLY